MRTWFTTCAALAIASAAAHAAAEELSPSSSAAASATETTITSFLGTYCTACHGAKVQKGERRFDELRLDASDVDALTNLQDIIDQLNLRAMPPEEAKRRPDDGGVRQIVDLLTQIVANGHAKLSSTGGRTVLRRLNRREYLNTVSDLFGLNMTMFDPTVTFPGDQMVMNMDNNGDALRTSGYLLDQYLEAAEQVVEKAFRLTKRPSEQTWTFKGGFHQDQPVTNRYGSVDYRYLRLFENPKSFRHIGAYAPIMEFAEGVPADGLYEIKVQVEALGRQPYDPNIVCSMEPNEPFRLAVVPGSQTAGTLHEPQPIEPVLAETTLGEDGPEWHTFKVWLDAGYTPRFIWPNGTMPEALTLLAKRLRRMPDRPELPQVRIYEVQIRGPLYDQWPPAGQREIFGRPTFEPSRTREILEAFASRAFRRPARTDEVDRLMAIVHKRRDDGRSPLDALKDGFKAVLCSPAFLYLAEPEPGDTGTDDQTLPAHALASRLSYFLWSTMPDAELSSAAQSGALLKPEVLVAQTRRLLMHEKSEALITGLLDSWLNLRSLGDMPPDRLTYEHYYSRDLENAIRRETRLFARHVLDENESIVDFLDADYTFLNRPLARLYGMEDAVGGADGHIFRKVALTGSNRGGLLGQASVLTVSANGVETSPVTRGIWLLENILGTPPAPPPDDVPAIEPDVRGAKSIREILSQHRTNSGCYECHRKIDPLGFALENFDPIGTWRTHYEKVDVKEIKITQIEITRTQGPRVDASGELPGGETFQDVAGLKRILVERKDQFARALTEKLLSYACGRQIEPLDRPDVDRIVSDLDTRGYGFRDLIELVVASESFRSK